MFDAYIFDLDGTILDTLGDLATLTNTVLAEHGMPTHTTAEINSYVGGGGRVLLTRAAPEGTAETQIDTLWNRWRELYPQLGHANTKPYAGIPETLAALKARGAKLGVLSNKYDSAVQDVIGQHYPGVFDVAHGECDDYPRKPDPTGLLRMMAELDVAPERCAFVGDSGIDMQTAVAAAAFPVGVSWGYRPVSDLQQAGAAVIIDAPEALLDVSKGQGV